jgi:hypothetical protein
MKEIEFIKLNFKFEISNFCTNVKVKLLDSERQCATCKHFDGAGI